MRLKSQQFSSSGSYAGAFFIESPIATIVACLVGLLLTNDFFLKGGCASSDQMPFLLTFFWRAFVFAMRTAIVPMTMRLPSLSLAYPRRTFLMRSSYMADLDVSRKLQSQ